MTVEAANQMQLAYIAESVFKTTPTTPTGQILRYVGCTLAADRNYLNNPELRTDRQKAAGRGGVILGKGDVSGVLSYGTYDALIEAALGGTWSANVVKVGTTRKSFTFERFHHVNDLGFSFKGVVVNDMELSGKADQNVEAKFGLIAAACNDESGTSIWTSTTAASTGIVLTTWDGSIKREGSAIGTVVGWTLKVDNGYQEGKVCGSKDLYDLSMGTCAVTGTLELYFDSYQLYTDFRAESSITLQINIGSGASSSYQIDLTDCRITKFGAPSTSDGMVTVSCEFESFTEATDTACKITRIP